MPSEALSRATTFDLYVLDVSTRWATYKHNVAEGNIKPIDSKQDLQWYMDLAKREHEAKQKQLAEQQND